MIPVQSHGQQFWLNFQHEKFTGAAIATIPSYGQLIEVLAQARAALLDGQIDTYKAVSARLRIDDTLQHIDDGLTPYSHRTLCKVSRKVALDESEVIVIGEARTAKGDNFCRRTGRWWALTRALEAMEETGLGYAGDFFAAYFQRPQHASKQELTAYCHWYRDVYLSKHPRVFESAA